MFIRLWGACVAVLLLHTAAAASPIAVTAPLSDGTTTWAQQQEIRGLLAAGLEGVPDVDPVIVIDITPAALTRSCLDDTRCLERVMIESEAPNLVTGLMGATDDSYSLDLVYFARGMVVRRQQFTVPTASADLRVAVQALTWELITGDKAPESVLAAAAKPPETDRPKKAKEPRPKKEKQARAPRPAKPERSPPTRPTRPEKTARAPRPPKQPRAPGASSGSSSELPRVRVTGRLGWSRYYTFDFLTVGAEAGFRVVGGLHVVGGAEVYAVNREVPSGVDPAGGNVWNAMVPLNIGALYAVKMGPLRPYLGADMIFAKYNRDAPGFATGGRARVGTDLMLSERVGLNLNVALGGWTGDSWERVHDTLGNSGFLPQVSGGTLITF